jgi:hypothetical protein
MSKLQSIILISGLVLTLGLYFMPIKPPKMGEVNRARELNMEATDELTLTKDARGRYSPTQLLEVDALMDLLEGDTSETKRISRLEQLSGAWYKLGEPAMAGVFAEKVAELKGDGESWAIAGTTYWG